MKCHFKWSSPPGHKYIELLVVREPGQPEPSAQGGSTSAATSQQGQGGRDHQRLVISHYFLDHYQIAILSSSNA